MQRYAHMRRSNVERAFQNTFLTTGCFVWQPKAASEAKRGEGKARQGKDGLGSARLGTARLFRGTVGEREERGEERRARGERRGEKNRLSFVCYRRRRRRGGAAARCATMRLLWI